MPAACFREGLILVVLALVACGHNDAPTEPPSEDPGTTAPQPDPCAGVDLQTAPANCGLCGHSCSFTNASALCEAGQCLMAECDAGFHDLDHDVATGCEYACAPTSPSTEVCDGQDNDC